MSLVKKALLILVLIALCSLVSLFFGYPLNNVFVINGIAGLAFLTLLGLIKLNSLIKNKLVVIIASTIVVIAELWAVGFFLLMMAMG